jgi:hypothetical protein
MPNPSASLQKKQQAAQVWLHVSAAAVQLLYQHRIAHLSPGAMLCTVHGSESAATWALPAAAQPTINC